MANSKQSLSVTDEAIEIASSKTKKQMDWCGAIRKSSLGTATRIFSKEGWRHSIIMYPDGCAYRLVSKDGRVNFDMSGIAKPDEFIGHMDWEPSEKA